MAEGTLYSHCQKLSRDCFALLAMTREGLLSLRGAEGDVAISASIHPSVTPPSHSRLLSRTAIIVGDGVEIIKGTGRQGIC
jgi:hypothetical protein